MDFAAGNYLLNQEKSNLQEKYMDSIKNLLSLSEAFKALRRLGNKIDPIIVFSTNFIVIFHHNKSNSRNLKIVIKLPIMSFINDPNRSTRKPYSNRKDSFFNKLPLIH
jgi:hypothetical protein